MSALSLPVSRPQGQALFVGQEANSTVPLRIMRKLGIECAQAANPYEAMSALCRQPTVFSAVIFSLLGLYREELVVISSIKSRFPSMEIWVSDTQSRQLVLADAMKLGADGLLDEDGLHRKDNLTSASSSDAALEAVLQTDTPLHAPSSDIPIGSQFSTNNSTDPLLTAEELRALLVDAPAVESQSQ